VTGVLRTPDVRFENLPDHPFAPNDVEVQTRTWQWHEPFLTA
jgi:hypothetical protein